MEQNALTKAAESKPTAPAVAQQQAAKKKMSPAEFVQYQITQRMSAIQAALPRDWNPKRFTRIAMTAISSNPKLAQACVQSPKTFLGAMMNAAQLGLEPNTSLGQAYILPYNNTDKNTGEKVLQVQFQIGVYGYIALAYRSGEIAMIDAQVRYEKDKFEYRLGLDPKLEHFPYDGEDRGPAIGYYGIFKMKSGAYGFKYMSKAEVLAHAKRFSKSYNRKTGKFYGPWETDFDSMAKKTVLLQALKYAPKASEDTKYAQAFINDNTVSDIDRPDAIPNKTDTIDAEYTTETSEPGEAAEE